MFSSRAPAPRALNRLWQMHAQLKAGGVEVADLTESNPTRVGLRYPADLLASLVSPAALVYEPASRGLPAARQAVAASLGRLLGSPASRSAAAAGGCAEAAGPTRPVDPGRVVLTASTSEAYACLFKLLCDPGDRVLVPQPSYPLLEHLARFEGVEPVAYPLVYDGAWAIDIEALRSAAGARTRTIVVVNPNNPTGSYLSRDDHCAVTALCRDRGLPIIVDEVFNRYPLDPLPDNARSVLDSPSDVLTFVLGGLSKAVGLPQVKLGWMVVDGPDAEVDAALDALDILLDTYLSVSTPVQLASARLLAAGAGVAAQIRSRVRTNHGTLARLVAEHPAADLLRAEGGWYAVIKVPATEAEEALVLGLLEHDHVLVHPGYFFDFQREAFLVTSLLPDPARFEPAVRRMLRRAAGAVR